MLAFDRPWALAFLLLLPGLFALARFLRPRGLAFPLAAGRGVPAAPFLFRLARLAASLALGLGLLAAVLAAAGPALVTKRQLYLGRGNEAIIVLDLSPSMAASDLAPTRLDAAKAIIGDFLATRRNETVGLVAFGDEAALVCPPTTDYGSISARLASLEPGLYGDGTAIGAGLATAAAHAVRSSAPEKHLILLTDGENNAGSMDPATAMRAAARFGISLSVIGVGSPGEAPVSYVDPVTKQKRVGIYRSNFDAAALEAMTRRAGGSYYGAENRAALAAAFSALAERSASLARSRSLSTSLGLTSRFLALGLACLALARLLGLAGEGQAVSFARPELLALALLALPEILLGARRIPAFRSSLEALAGPRRRGRAGRHFAAFSVASSSAAALFVLCAATALAGPSWGARGFAAERRGLEAAVVLDVSRSMEARDMGGLGPRAESRLDAAKSLISALIRGPGLAAADDGRSGGSAFSLVAAKGGAVLLVPMTEDLFAFDDALAYANPDAISSPGTDLERALRAGLSSFSGSGAQGRVLFLFTDGGELTGSARRACEEAASSKARLVVVGLGGATPAAVPGPEGLPLVGPKGAVRSVLEAASLKSLAALSGGRYIDASDAGAGAALAAELAAGRGKGMRIEYEPLDRSGIFALLALAFLVAAILASLLSTREARS